MSYGDLPMPSLRVRETILSSLERVWEPTTSDFGYPIRTGFLFKRSQ